MSVRQYVGARYVPKFYQNTQNSNSSEWETNHAYEAMTIVTYNNSSYTSKIPVPIGVGNPAQNPTYWANTGNYNSQVDLYRQETEQISNKIDNLAIPRNFVLIGDSFSSGIDGNNNTSVVSGGGWKQRFKNMVSSYSNVYFEDYSTKGIAGFSSTYKFIEQLKNVENGLTELQKNSITDIVVLGGTNENQSQAVIESDIKAFCEYCHTHFRSAIIKIGVLTSQTYNAEHTDYYKAYSNCGKYGAYFLFDTTRLYSFLKYVGSDGTHLTAEGYDYYTPKLNEIIYTGHAYYRYNGHYNTISTTGGSLTWGLSTEMIVAPNYLSFLTGFRPISDPDSHELLFYQGSHNYNDIANNRFNVAGEFIFPHTVLNIGTYSCMAQVDKVLNPVIIDNPIITNPDGTLGTISLYTYPPTVSDFIYFTPFREALVTGILS